MKRLLFCLVPWMAMAAVASAQTRSADVVYTYFGDAPTHGFRVGDECFVPIEDVSRWGWQVDAHSDSANVTAEGNEFTIPLRTISGKVSLPIRAAMAKLGATADWIVNTDTLQVLSDLSSVSVDSGRIKVKSPLQFKLKAFVLTDPSRAVIDFVGARMGAKTSQVLEGGVRLSQYKPDVVRLVIQTTGVADVSKISLDPTKSCDFELTIGTQSDDKTSHGEQKQDVKVPVKKTDDGIVDGSALGSNDLTLPIALDREDDKSADLSIRLKGSLKAPATFAKPSPDVLQITLPGVNADLGPDFKLATDSVASVSCAKSAKGTVVTLNLARPLGAEVYSSGQNVAIKLYKPNVGDGRLVGKIVVVDAGHGGEDSGASSAGLKEKDFNLPIAKLLSERLTEQGATVIMTRKTDVFIPLTTRSNISNDSHADFFISCHINDTGRGGNMSGGITFHHKGNEISHVLAECIQQQIGAVSGIPNLGVWSDGKIYPTSGFSVLRNTKCVCVLIEFGFLNNEFDRKHVASQQFQDAVTKAVVKGLQVYLGNAKSKE